MIQEYRFDSRSAMLDALLEVCSAAINQDVAEKGCATLLLSGGSTPGPLYQQLAETALPWHQVQVALVDERWVEADHTASNEGLLRRTLLQSHGAQAQYIPMKTPADTAACGENECNNAYEQLQMPASFCLLGMGPDGHTASLFPQAQGLEKALSSERPCAAIMAKQSAVTGELTERMSLTPSAILPSKKLVLMITGEDKWAVYQEAKTANDVTLMPVSAILQKAERLDVYWAP